MHMYKHMIAVGTTELATNKNSKSLIISCRNFRIMKRFLTCKDINQFTLQTLNIYQ